MVSRPAETARLRRGSLDAVLRDPERLARFYAEATRLSAAESVEGVLARTAQVARSLSGAEQAEVTVTAPFDGERVFRAGSSSAPAGARIEQQILLGSRRYATLRLATGRARFLPEEEAAAELLCMHAALVLEQVAPSADDELLGRVQGVLRDGLGVEPVREVGDIRIDARRYQVLVAGVPVHTTLSEFRLLQLLAEEPGRPYTRAEIAGRLWDTDSPSSLRIADTHVTRLRRKIEPDPAHPRYVETVRGVGYRLVADATVPA